MKKKIIDFKNVPGKLDFSPKKFFPVFGKSCRIEVEFTCDYEAPVNPDQQYKIVGIGNIFSPRLYSVRLCFTKVYDNLYRIFWVLEKNGEREIVKFGDLDYFIFQENSVCKVFIEYDNKTGNIDFEINVYQNQWDRLLFNDQIKGKIKAKRFLAYQISNPYMGGSVPVKKGYVGIRVSIEKLENKNKVFPFKNIHVFILGLITLFVATLDNTFFDGPDAITRSEKIAVFLVALFIAYSIYFTIKAFKK